MIPDRKEIKELLNDENIAIAFAYEKRLITGFDSCPVDGYSMRKKDDFRYKCKRKKHRKIYSSLTGTIFKRLRIPFTDFFFILYSWITEVPNKSIILQSGNSSKTISRILKGIRNKIACSIELSNIKIGGPGVIVQLDECKFGKRKYNRGHHVEGTWVFGGVEVTSERKLFSVIVDKRDAITLNNLILKHVLPGSIVITDGWKGYNLFKNNSDFEHQWVNHSITFKNHEGYHTNHIEGTWAGIKSKIPKQGRIKRKMQGYLFEFIWRRTNNSNLWNNLIELFRLYLFFYLLSYLFFLKKIFAFEDSNPGVVSKF